MAFVFPWRNGLLQTMKDPSYIMMENDTLVAIRDKYPKAKNHFLVLPKENIDTIFKLNKSHIQLIQAMSMMAMYLIKVTDLKYESFLIGFHAEPSMIRLHLHVISKDFTSKCLKTKNHWNSFTEPFLWTPEKIISDLETFGKVQQMTESEVYRILDAPLQCNTCPYKAKNMPDLKRHLLTHEAMYSESFRG